MELFLIGASMTQQSEQLISRRLRLANEPISLVEDPHEVFRLKDPSQVRYACR
jgi:hypothetical protein